MRCHPFSGAIAWLGSGLLLCALSASGADAWKPDRPVELIVGATAGGGRRSPPSRSWHSMAASGRDFIFGRNSSTLLLPWPYGYCASLKSGYNVYLLT